MTKKKAAIPVVFLRWYKLNISLRSWTPDSHGWALLERNWSGVWWSDSLWESRRGLRTVSRGVRSKACEKEGEAGRQCHVVSDGKLVKKQNKNRRGLEKVPMVVRQKACEKRGGAWGQCYVVSDWKLVRKEAGLGDSVTWCQIESLWEKRRGLGTMLRGVRSKACEKRGGAWGQCYVMSDRKLVRKEAGLGDNVTWCQIESLWEKRRGLGTMLRDVRSKACEKRGGAWGQCYMVSDRKLVRKEAGLGDSVTWCQIESLWEKRRGLETVSGGVRAKACQKRGGTVSRGVRRKACEKWGGAWQQYISSTTCCQIEILWEMRRDLETVPCGRGLETVPRGVRPKAYEERGGAWISGKRRTLLIVCNVQYLPNAQRKLLWRNLCTLYLLSWQVRVSMDPREDLLLTPFGFRLL